MSRSGRHAAASAAGGLAAAAVLAALTAGTPWLMWHVAGWPLPRHVPTLTTLRAGIAGQESARFILALVTCAGWMIWLVFVTEVILEAVWWARQLSGLARSPAGRPGAAWLRERAAAVSPPRAVATILVGGVLLGLLAAVRGTGTALTIPAVPRLAAVTQRAAAPPPRLAGIKRGPVLQTRAAVLPGSTAAGSGPVPAGTRIMPGWAIGRILRLDIALQTGQEQPASETYILYTVRPGDNLWDIALTHLGNGEKWHQIYDLNAGILQPDGERLVLPSLIQPGWRLRLPAPAAVNHSGHPPAPRPPASPSPARPRPAKPEPNARLHQSPAPSPHPRAGQAPGHGIALPWGGLAGASLAAAVAVALARASLRRRRRYQPPRIMTADLRPLPKPPPVIGVLHRAAQPPAAHRTFEPGQPGGHAIAAGPASPPAAPQPRPEAASVSPLPGKAHEPGVIPVGLRDDREETADLAALGGLGLTGPGATAAARAMLLTLLTHAPSSVAVPAQVIIPAADATALIPGYSDTKATAGSRAGLTVTATLETALDQLEAALLTRARITSGASDGDPGSPVGNAALIAAPAPRTSERLAAILQLGRQAGITAILLGTWPHGVTCTVAADSTVTATTPPAPGLDGLTLFHLAAADTQAILSVLDTASDDEPASPPPGGGTGDPARSPGPAEHDDGQAAPHPQPASGRQNPAAQPAPQNHAPGARRDDLPPAVDSPRAPRIVQVNVLGPPQITARGREITGGLRKARELLAFLALHPDGATGEMISEALWPEAPPGHGTTQRAIALRRSRALLREATGLTEPMFIILTADRYRLDPGLVSTDITQFQNALETARNAADDDACLAACQDAARLYRGPLADATGWQWAEPYAEAARRRALDTWTRIAEILAPRDPDRALAALETAVSHDPYNEFAYQKIMRLQAAAGRLDAVRRTLSLLESRLRDLGVTPGPQTRTLAATLLGVPAPQRSARQPAQEKEKTRQGAEHEPRGSR